MKKPSLIKRILPRSLLGRSMLILVIPVLLLQVFSVFMFYERHWSRIEDRFAFAVGGEISMLLRQVEHGEDLASGGEFSDSLNRFLDLNVEFLAGQRLSLDEGHAHRVRSSGAMDSLSQILKMRTDKAFTVKAVEGKKQIDVNIQLDDGVLKISFPESRLFSSSGYIFLLWMIGSSIILVAIAVLFMKNQIKPIKRLSIAAEKLGKGREVPYLKVEGAKEVRQAAKAFIEMRERIDRQIQQRTEMLAGVSHDLRTPLTRLKLQIEMLSDTNRSDIKDMRKDIEDMEKMINAYLQFARGEGGETPERTELVSLLQKMVDTVGKDKTEITLDTKEDISLMLRPIAFERCIGNIIANAKEHADSISVSAKKITKESGNIVEILIDDNGKGVPEELHEDLFKPFYRADNARNLDSSDTSSGVGLGLSIAQSIIHTHGGWISLHKSPMGGLRVRIILPI